MLDKIVAFFTPVQNWTCRYWRFYDAERFSSTFHTQQEAHEFSEKQHAAGYVTMVQRGADSDHTAVISAFTSVLSGTFLAPLKEIITLVNQHFTTNRHK